MNYSHSPEKAGEFASEALDRIYQENLAPIPPVYEVWYAYYAGLNADITRAIDILVSADSGISNEKCLEIYQRFLSQSSENERVKEAGDSIQKTIRDVGGAVKSVREATAGYNAKLEEVSEKLADHNAAPDDIRNVVHDMMSNTSALLQQNQKLEEELGRSARIMSEMQRDLEKVRQEALTDGLTNLANRKAFDAEIVRVIEQSKEDDQMFCLLMMDIDHFKSFNDNYGHQVGDQVLRLVARTLVDGVKGRDVVARYGGEEFAVILPATPLQAGVKVGDSLRHAVANKEVVNRNSGETLGRITLSGGIAQYVPGESVSALIERADTALYAAKRNGRNQISIASLPDQQKAAG
ncbi:MAG: GGDEF domain-containing protein [Bdellovibrionales bacterium]